MSHIRRINRVGLDEAIVLQAHEIVNASSDILPLLSLPPLDLLGLPNLPLPPLPLPSPSPVLSNAPLPDLPLPTSSSNSKKRRQTSPSTSGAGAPPQPSPPAPELQPPSTRPRRSSQANTNINKVPEVLPPTPDQSHRPTSSQPSPFAGMNDLLKAAEVLLEDVGPIAPTIFPRPPMAEEEEELPRIIPRERLPKRRRVEHSDWAPPPSKQSLPPSKQNQHPRRVPQSTWVPPLINPNQSTAIASSSSVIHHTPDVYSALEVLADQAASAFSSHLTSKIYTSHNSSLSGLSILSPPTVSRLSKNLPSVNDGANGSGTGAGNTVGVNRSTLNTSKLQFGDPGQLYVVKDETAGEKQKRERSPYIKVCLFLSLLRICLYLVDPLFLRLFFSGTLQKMRNLFWGFWPMVKGGIRLPVVYRLGLSILHNAKEEQPFLAEAKCSQINRSYHQCRQRWLRGLRCMFHFLTSSRKLTTYCLNSWQRSSRRARPLPNGR